MSIIRCDDINVDWKERALGLRDAIELLRGKWKFRILKTLAYGSLRFKDLQEKLNISPKVLTRELQELEQNLLIARTVKKTKPITVEYSVTEYARETRLILEALITFGENHRKKIKSQIKAS
ncbi:HxlR family transcriptional regulator [Chitinophaga niastensis]|uniref:HxlR family transcriptional regulator n=1 Tax=Chitinophaga niastensis TaxID=536980 RepID=A0A2P8HD54_CHINA|nr:helix-turn-helix domain-containing protein [Chitinophaga niastensis]PSL44159.1 HxlR family transcriptional regulator [Chitinophaga niastensis]